MLWTSIASILHNSRIAAEAESSAPPPKRQRTNEIPQPDAMMVLLDGLADDAGTLPGLSGDAGGQFNMQQHEELIHWAHTQIYHCRM